MAVARMKRSVIREFPAVLKSPGFHFVASRLRCCHIAKTIYYHVLLGIGFAPAGASYLFWTHKKRNPKNASRALVLRIPSAIFTANGSSWLASMLDKTRLTVHGHSPLPVKLSSASLTGGTVSPWSLPSHSALVGPKK